MPADQPIDLGSIRVFPNSGHHVQFFPLFADATSDASAHERLTLTDRAAQLNDDVRARLKAICQLPPKIEANIIESAPPWIRAWFGVQERKIHGRTEDEGDLNVTLIGVWVAVESNLGPRSRGYVTRESSPPIQSEIDAFVSGGAVETPYACEKVADLRDKESVYTIFLDGIGTDTLRLPLCRVTISWLKPDGDEINVDLVIDFGNTRTAVLALEHLADSPSFAPICKPIPFHATDAIFGGHDGFAFDESTVLTDSWFLLRQPQFEGLVVSEQEIPDWHVATENRTTGWGPFKRAVPVGILKKVVYRTPQMFVEISPALMGPSARKELLFLNLDHGAKCFLSSPKRYAWDSDPVDGEGAQNWHMVPHDRSLMTGDITAIPNLECQMLRFMVADGTDWLVDNPPTVWEQHRRPVRNPKNPRYPRSDTLAWAALSVIENAYRTINSDAWRKGNHPLGSRRLNQILVTYPSGWTAKEIEAYRLKWQKAINIFMLTHLEHPSPDALKLVMNLDEAVASQLPIVVSEIRRLGDDGRRWIDALGRGVGGNGRVRVMTIDIGGGTTDISIVEYQDLLEGQGVDLRARVLFKDSSSIAGDELRKMLVERVLLPEVLGRRDLDREKFETLLAGVQTTMASYAKWARYTRVLLLPIVNRWLADLAGGRNESFTIADLFQTNEDGQILEDFNKEAVSIVDVDLIDKQLDLSMEARGVLHSVQQCVSDCFDQPFRSLAKHVAAFRCDLVIVSGKPSELPPIRKMLEEFLPVSLNRLIFALKYCPGASNWPLSADGKVHDAKFVTVVGAALAQAIQTNLIHGWMLKVDQDSRMLTQNWWGVPSGNRLKPVLLQPEQSEHSAKVMIGSAIARKLLPGDTAPELVYVLRWRNKEWRKGPTTTMDVTFKRIAPQLVGAGESLQIGSAQGILERTLPDGRIEKIAVSEKDIELKLCTLQQGAQYWLDTGRFEVHWADGTNK